jgi:transposase-like protein
MDGPMLNIRDLIDEARCSKTVREKRWPDRIILPQCSSESAIKDGRDDTQAHQQSHLCHGCLRRFDDLPGTSFAGHHQPPRSWILCPHPKGEYAREDNGDGFCETHVNTLEEF